MKEITEYFVVLFEKFKYFKSCFFYMNLVRKHHNQTNLPEHTSPSSGIPKIL